MKNLFDLTGKRALITGSAQGIGNLLASGLAAHGAEIVINDITQQRAQTAANASRFSSIRAKSELGFHPMGRRRRLSLP